MDGTTEKDCSLLWSLYQQIVSDMKNSTPMWEEFISKATKLHSALKSALSAITAFLDSFQKIADAATNARGATKEIGTALTRVCLRHRAIETRMKTFISTLMEALITPLTERTDEWRRGCGTGALSREHARECKRARAELRRRVHDAQRHVRKARRAPPDAKRRADVCVQDVQERKTQLEEMEEKAVKAALIEERSRFCHFVALLNPVVESEVAMLAEVGHLQEGSEQLMRHTTEPRTLPPASLQVVCDIKSCASDPGSAPHSPPTSCRLGSRKSSLTSISSLGSHCSDQQHVSGSTVSCSTPISNASSVGTLPPPGSENQHCLSQKASGRLPSVCGTDSGFRSQDALHRQMSLYVDNGSDNQSVSSECTTPSKNNIDDSNHGSEHDGIGNAASATWPDLKDTAQFERAASAIMSGRPHTISAAYERGHPRPALSVHTFSSQNEMATPRDGPIYARPPLPTRCSSLERPSIPAKTNLPGHEYKTMKPSCIPAHLAKEMPQAVYVNMSELASLAASRAQQNNANNANSEQPHQEKVCSESSASESSLESSSGYGSQGAFANEEHVHQIQLQHAEVLIESEIVTLRRSSEASINAARDSFSVSLGSLEEAVRSLDEVCEHPFATIGKKPAVPKRGPVSMTASVWSRRGSASSLGKPPPPVRRSSSISRNRGLLGPQSPQMASDDLPPPPAFLLQPESDVQQNSVAETVKQLTELQHTPASPSLLRRSLQQINQPDLRKGGVYASSNRTHSTSPLYGHTGHRMTTFTDPNPTYGRRGSVTSCTEPDLYEPRTAPSPTHSFASFGGSGGFKQENQYGVCGIYCSPSQLTEDGCRSPQMARRAPSAERRRQEHGSLIASLSAKLAPQLSPRTSRRTISTIQPADPVKGKAAVQAGFLDKLSATIQQQKRVLDSTRATTVRDIMNAQTQPDPRVCHTSLMEQIKRGATLRRNKHCNDRSAPKIR